MDGPNVNLLSIKKLDLDLKKGNKTLMDVGTCPHHIASNAFLEDFKILSAELEIDLDQTVLN